MVEQIFETLGLPVHGGALWLDLLTGSAVKTVLTK
jgi:hypothetical protein